MMGKGLSGRYRVVFHLFDTERNTDSLILMNSKFPPKFDTCFLCELSPKAMMIDKQLFNY